MRIVTQMLVLDRVHRDRLRSVQVTTCRKITRAESELSQTLKADARSHTARIASHIGLSPA